MNYIAFDLEWNQAAYKIDEEEDLPFEIIEIGAVKLNSDGEIIDELQMLIRPQVYPFLVRKTRELTGWTDDDLDREGIYFEDAIVKFLDWCGRDYMFLEWGPSDLPQLQRNMAYYNIRIPWKYPLKYLDVQKLFALQEQEGKTRRTLEKAIDFYQIEKDRKFHHAADDAYFTARVFQHIDRKKYEAYYSVDYYKVPRNMFEETTFYFETYSKYVSRSFPLKEEALQNRRVREMRCMKCRKQLKKQVPWFSDNGKVYLAIGVCKEHGKMKGKIRIKTTEDYRGYFVIRTIKPCPEDDEQMILGKRDNLKEKRRERRKRSSKKAAENRAAQAAKEGTGKAGTGKHYYRRKKKPAQTAGTQEAVKKED